MSERNVPTRPGWWWGCDVGNGDEVVFEVQPLETGGFAAYCGDQARFEDDVVLLAPVPSPAVCAALATLADRLAALDASEGEEPHAFGEQASGMFRELLAALRAERVGGRG